MTAATKYTIAACYFFEGTIPPSYDEELGGLMLDNDLLNDLDDLAYDIYLSLDCEQL